MRKYYDDDTVLHTFRVPESHLDKTIKVVEDELRPLKNCPHGGKCIAKSSCNDCSAYIENHGCCKGCKINKK